MSADDQPLNRFTGKLLEDGMRHFIDSWVPILDWTPLNEAELELARLRAERDRYKEGIIQHGMEAQRYPALLVDIRALLGQLDDGMNVGTFVDLLKARVAREPHQDTPQ